MHTATLHQIGETLLIEVPRELAKKRQVKPGDSVNFDLLAKSQVTESDLYDDSKLDKLSPEARRQLSIMREIMREDREVLHALAQ